MHQSHGLESSIQTKDKVNLQFKLEVYFLTITKQY